MVISPEIRHKASNPNFSLHQERFIFLSKGEIVFSYEVLQNKLLNSDPGYSFA